MPSQRYSVSSSAAVFRKGSTAITRRSSWGVLAGSWTEVGNDGQVRLDGRQVAEALRISAELLDGSAARLDDATLEEAGLLEKLRPAATLADATAEIRRLATAAGDGADPGTRAGIRHVRIIRVSAELLHEALQVVA